MNYSVIGLGKLGASMAAAIAKRGFDVVGVDVSRRAVDLVNDGRAPVQETDLDETIFANRSRIRATLSHREAVLATDVSFVVVPTPSDERGAFALQYAAWAFKEIGRALAEKDAYHIVVMTSTVLPGATRYGLLPILERESGKTCGREFGLCYSPEFIALGSVMRDFLNPDFTLVGELDERSGAMLERCYAGIMENRAPCRRMSIENAELTKIAVNTFVTTKITFANMLADLCERIPGGDVDAVTNALGSDTRIGRKYLTGALGYGGPCFPRDNVALAFVARALGSRAALAEATDQANRALAPRFAESLRHELPAGSTVAVLGVAYKPCSHVVEESQGMALARSLSKSGMRVVAYDPLAMDAARADLPEVVFLDSPQTCLEQADVVVITTPDPEFQALSVADLERGLAARDRGGVPLTLVDVWRIADPAVAAHPCVRYVPVGRSRDDDANAEKLRGLWEQASEVAHHPHLHAR